MTQPYADALTFSNLEFYRRNHGKQLYYSWAGSVWRIPVPGAEPEKIFSIIGMNATKVFIREHPEYGEAGHRLNRELALYCHPETGDILYTWQSQPNTPPVTVVPIANRMVQGTVRPRDLTVPAGHTYKKVVNEIPLDYPHPLAQDERYREYCPGERFQGTEYFTTYVSRPDAQAVPPAEWARDCPWLPWMRLGYGNPTRLRFETSIARVKAFEDLHPNLVALVRDRVPVYEFTPDATEEPNVTSITYFKRHFDDYLRGTPFPLPDDL